MTTPTKPGFALSDRDKTPNASGWGYTFHHTTPQRRVPCALGNMLAPRSADDIPPITREAMASVQAAIALLANLVGDRDHNLFLANADQNGRMTAMARDIAHVAKSLAGILRVEASTVSACHVELAIRPTIHMDSDPGDEDDRAAKRQRLERDLGASLR